MTVDRGDVAGSLRSALYGLLALALAMGIGRFAFTPLLPMMQDENLLSIEAGGVLASIHFWGYAAGAFLLAPFLSSLADRGLFWALLFVGLTTLAMAFPLGLVAWAGARFLAGVASAVVLIAVGSTVVRSLTLEGQSSKQGLVFAGVGIGIAATGLACLIAMVVDLDTPSLWIGFGLLTLLAAGLLFPKNRTSRFTDENTRDALPRFDGAKLLPLFAAYAAVGAGYIIPATYLPVMAREIVEDPVAFGWGWPIFGSAAAVSTLLVIPLASRFGNLSVWFASQLVMAAGLFITTLYQTLPAIFMAAVAVGGTFMVITMVGIREANRLAGRSNPQKFVAWLTAAFAMGQIVGPAAASWAFAVSQSFALPMGIAAGFVFVTALPLLRSRA